MKRGTFFILAALIFGPILKAQGQDLLQKEIVYKIIDGISLKADLSYLEDLEKAGTSPAIAFFHGGGWSSGSPSEFHEACIRYARKGFITFSFHYRLSANEDGTIPHSHITPVECVKDARSAIRWMREHAAEYGIDPHKIVACGQWAGGQLALSTALIDDVNEASDKLDVSPVPDALIPYEGRRHYLGDGDSRYGRYYDEEILMRTDSFLIDLGYLDPGAI